VVNPSHGAEGNAANPARFLRPLHFAVEKHVAYRTENGALYGRPNGMPAVRSEEQSGVQELTNPRQE